MSEPSHQNAASRCLRGTWRWFRHPGDWRRLIGVVVLGIVLGIGAFAAAYWWFDSRSNDTEADGTKSSRANTYDVVRSAVAATGVITVGAGATVALLRHKINEDNLKLAQESMALTQASVEVTLKKLSLEEDANRTDRYTKAVEQLGSDSIHVRLGGIYALKRLADDSERDLPTIVEVLAAFIRATTAATKADDDASNAVGMSRPPQATSPGTDIHAALTSLSRINTATPTLIDLTRAYLPGANLSGANLSGANLGSADLTSASLSSANLSSANLTNANLTNANLTSAKLTHANLLIAKLANANLAGANLIGATLHLANLTDANLTSAKLGGANLTRADLTRAFLTNANLTRADLTNANLHKITWEGTTWPDGFTPPPSYDPEARPPGGPPS